jgi:diacylglycerol kinase (CTP)
MREKEIHGFNGVIWYILGLDFAFSFTTKDISVLAVLLLSWSDTAASTCGRAWGHLTPKIARNKSLAGSLAAFCVGVISSYILYGYIVPEYSQYNTPGSIFWTPETSYLNLHTMSFLAGIVAALSEGIDLFNWDDNFTIPVLSSIFFYVVIYAFHK